MGNNNGSAYHVTNGKQFEEFGACYTEFMAFAEMIFNAVIAAEYQRSNQAHHFFGFC
jgi:hypothetical protein